MESASNYMEQSKEVAVVENGQTKMVGLDGLGPIDAMIAKLKAHDERRNVILDYVEANLVPDVDFGCTDDRSPHKKTLMKPGAEKVCRLFNTSPRWKPDYSTWEMAGKPNGTIFLICEIVDNATGNVIGEGRGAATIGQKGRDANKAIKNAEKCAVVDAALYTFMLSEKFTQDDGGKKQSLLNEWKHELSADVSDLRTLINSDITTHAWIQKVVKSILKKSRIDTLGEYREVRKQIFEDKKYKLENGELHT